MGDAGFVAHVVRSQAKDRGTITKSVVGLEERELEFTE